MTRRPLTLDGPEFTVRAEKFANMVQVPEFQERLFNGPAAVAWEEFGSDINSATMSDTSRMTFALLTGSGFSGWADDFQTRVDVLLPADGVGGLETRKALKSQSSPASGSCTPQTLMLRP